MYFREPIEVWRLTSGWKQVNVHLIGDDLMYLEIPKGFFEPFLVDKGWVAL